MNSLGSFTCGCRSGYRTVDETCLDIDECRNRESCPVNSICENSEANFTCICNEGYQGIVCTDDVDECATNTSSCDENAWCSNSIG